MRIITKKYVFLILVVIGIPTLSLAATEVTSYVLILEKSPTGTVQVGELNIATTELPNYLPDDDDRYQARLVAANSTVLLTRNFSLDYEIFDSTGDETAEQTTRLVIPFHPQATELQIVTPEGEVAATENLRPYAEYYGTVEPLDAPSEEDEQDTDLPVLPIAAGLILIALATVLYLSIQPEG